MEIPPLLFYSPCKNSCEYELSEEHKAFKPASWSWNRPRSRRRREHSRFKRHSSLTESHLQMSDNRSYVNYTRLHTYGIPLYPSAIHLVVEIDVAGRDGWRSHQDRALHLTAGRHSRYQRRAALPASRPWPAPMVLPPHAPSKAPTAKQVVQRLRFPMVHLVLHGPAST
jgi:hypothetical protein